MKRRYVYLGLLTWAGILCGMAYLYRSLPPGIKAKGLWEGKRILHYLKEDFLPIWVKFPRRFVFSLVASSKYRLDEEVLSEELVDQLSRYGYYPTSQAKLKVLVRGKVWRLDDEGGFFLILRKEGNLIQVYEDVFLLPDDPINLWDGEKFLVVGRVKERKVKPGETFVGVEIYPDRADLLTEKAEFFYARDFGTFREVISQLFAGESGEMVRKELEKTFLEKKEEIFDILSPVLQRLVGRALPYLKQGLLSSIERHQKDLLTLVQREVLEKRLIPALEREIWPVVQKRAPPVIRPIARELWEAFPLMGIVGREILYRMYLSKKSGEARWQEYVKNKAIPILEKHKPKLIALAEDIAAEVASKPSVRRALEEGTAAVFSHEKFRKALEAIFMEGIVKNEELKRILLEQWGELEEAILKLTALFEPSIRRAADYLLCKNGDYRQGINPRLARVLRQQILWKDTQWIQVEPGKGKGKIQAGMTFLGKRVTE